MKIGLLVNPIAGMGGNVGLKGTDGEMYNKALELGAEPITPVRIKEVLKLINRQNIEFLVSPGNMGEDYIKDFNFDYKIIGKINKKQLMKIQKT
jgi:predicted polyphosphate/ATP-dependent NAD kinase